MLNVYTAGGNIKMLLVSLFRLDLSTIKLCNHASHCLVEQQMYKLNIL